MRLISLPIKNATINWWRALTLGVFIFFTGFIMIVFNSVGLTIMHKMQNSIINGFTGHIQIRAALSEEDDIVDIIDTSWENLIPLDNHLATDILQIINDQFPAIESSARIRQNALLVSDDDKAMIMLMGINPELKNYQNSFKLIEGRYLNPANDFEILLTRDQAEDLNVKPGDIIGAVAQTKDGYMADAALEVAGIGNFEMISVLTIDAGYVDIKTAQWLMGFEQQEVTDIILYLPETKSTQSAVRALKTALETSGTKTVMTNEQVKKNDHIKLSTYKDMGGFLVGMANIIALLFNVLIIFLLIIICILIVNLVFMTGIERYREIGTLRAIGFSKGRVIKLFITEILLIAAIFGLLGISLGSGLILLLGRTGIPSPSATLDYIMGKILYLELDAEQVIITGLIIMGFTFLSAIFPAYRACSLRPVQALQEN